ncbi:GNAT family N-acetyltransferase [Yeosuana marina]|uniref:GNAT family N-acetyltransferase n=1 Tax=Yeosuana marina TaxID=1565536 RepID=UPI0030C8CD04
MNLSYRTGKPKDLIHLKKLAILSWGHYKKELTPENWTKLSAILNDDNNYQTLLDQSHTVVCETEDKEIIGMAYIVLSGNPTEIYDKNWSYIRFLSVHPNYEGQGIGRKLTKQCIDIAKANNEKHIALHTSIMMKKARQLYESLGFEILREIEPRLGKKYWLYLLNL